MSAYWLSIEDITANALLEQMKIDPNNRFVSYKAIDVYGNYVANILMKQGDTVNNS